MSSCPLGTHLATNLVDSDSSILVGNGEAHHAYFSEQFGQVLGEFLKVVWGEFGGSAPIFAEVTGSTQSKGVVGVVCGMARRTYIVFSSPHSILQYITQ